MNDAAEVGGITKWHDSLEVSASALQSVVSETGEREFAFMNPFRRFSHGFSVKRTSTI